MRYEIKGETLPVVICHLEDGEQMVTEKGAMSWMSPNMKMESGARGGLGKAFGRMFSGDSIFQNIYTAERGNGMIAFASSFPGSIKVFEVGPGQEYVLQKSAFLASEASVELSIHFRRKSLPGCSEARDSLCKKYLGREPSLLSLMVMWWSMSCGQISRLSLILDIWQLCLPHAVLRSRVCRVSRIWYLEGRAFLTP